MYEPSTGLVYVNEAAHAASFDFSPCQFPGLHCQAAIADSRQPTLPAESDTDFGNRPRFISLHSVALENEVIPNTSFSRMNLSNLLTIAPLRVHVPAKVLPRQRSRYWFELAWFSPFRDGMCHGLAAPWHRLFRILS